MIFREYNYLFLKKVVNMLDLKFFKPYTKNMKKNKKYKKVTIAKFFKITFYFSLIISIVLGIVSIVFLCNKILEVSNFLILNALHIFLSMITFGQYISFEEIETIQADINSKIAKIKKGK